MSTFKKGDVVRQIVPVIEGTVGGFQVDQETGDRLVLVDYTDADGGDCSRYFKETEIEAVAGAEDNDAVKPSAEEGAASASANQSE